jgi:hypothetical protein
MYADEKKTDPLLCGMPEAITVDRSQGCEWALVILNTVRSGVDGLGHTRDRRRVNVAMTRARKGFVLVCDVGRFKQCQHVWAEYIAENEATVVSEELLGVYLDEVGVETEHKRQLYAQIRGD